MSYQTCFQRHEQKYLITKEQQARLLTRFSAYITPDAYPQSSVRNIYLDTDTYLFIRRSLEKTVYKEKLRVRSYGRAGDTTAVFIELKKKYKGIVYKRRLAVSLEEARDWLLRKHMPLSHLQIAEEIAYVLSRNPSLSPRAFLSYNRAAYVGKDNPLLRLTFDTEILSRTGCLSLTEPPFGTLLLPPQEVLMEIKTPDSLPFWLTRALSEEGIYKTSFSKYGTAYRTLIYPALHKEARYA